MSGLYLAVNTGQCAASAISAVTLGAYIWRSEFELYNDDPRFRENYEKVAPNLSEFMRQAVKVYVEKRRK